VRWLQYNKTEWLDGDHLWFLHCSCTAVVQTVLQSGQRCSQWHTVVTILLRPSMKTLLCFKTISLVHHISKYGTKKKLSKNKEQTTNNVLNQCRWVPISTKLLSMVSQIEFIALYMMHLLDNIRLLPIFCRQKMWLVFYYIFHDTVKDIKYHRPILYHQSIPSTDELHLKSMPMQCKRHIVTMKHRQNVIFIPCHGICQLHPCCSILSPAKQMFFFCYSMHY